MSGFGGYLKEHEEIIVPGAWEEITTTQFIAQRRIPTHFDTSSIAVALQAGALTVNRQLQSLVIDGVAPSFDVIHAAIYKRAIFALAHADLLCEFATQDRREAAENVAEDSIGQADKFRSQANADIALLLGLSTNTVALI